MKKIVALIFGLSLVLYLSAPMSAQSKGGGRDPGGAPEVRHGKDHEARIDHKQKNFEERIERNPALKTKLESMLPAGTTLRAAASGFRNQGQFIAALHVSKNLGISFDQLKAKMTGSNSMSLGQAIHALKPNLSEKDAEKEADKAEKEAKLTQQVKPIT